MVARKADWMAVRSAETMADQWVERLVGNWAGLKVDWLVEESALETVDLMVIRSAGPMDTRKV